MPSPKQLPTRQLGKNGPSVTGLGFGLMGLSIGYGQPPPDEERFALLDRAWELGETFWDSAAGYGDSEVLVGKWFAQHPERRTDIFLATKFGLGAEVDENGNRKLVIDSSPKKCRESCEASLSKLGVDHIDLFYVHRFDEVTPVEETVKMMVQLKNEGKIKHIGFSECSSETLCRGFAVHPIAALQVEYSPWTLDIEDEASNGLLRTCRDLGISIVAYSPLSRGFLSGEIKSVDDFDATDARRRFPRFQPENFSKNLELVKAFQDLAAQKGCTASQAALAWVMAQGPDFLPIPGTKRIKYLEENLGAFDVKISKDDDGRIRELLGSMGGAAGKRYNDMKILL